MQIKTYRAKSMREALAMVRNELGPEASLLHTREAPRGLIARLLKGVEIEVAATADRAPQTAAIEASQPLSINRSAEPLVTTNRISEPLKELETLVGGLDGVDGTENVPSELAAANSPNDPLFLAYTEMIEAGFSPEVAGDLIASVKGDLLPRDLSDSAVVDRRLIQAIEDLLPTSGAMDASGIGCRIAALVGPTGVGKTTTLAKLAAGFRLNEGLRVGLITVDTYRVAAVEQLRTYAEIIDLPMEVVSTPYEMREAVAKLADLDLVLIDTAGRSPRDSARIEELKALLAEAAPDEVHLVMSATTAPRALDDIVQRFAGVGATSLLMTKLDEATELGHVVGVVRDSRLPISYLTDGQGVPEDIRVAQSGSLARMLIGRESR